MFVKRNYVVADRSCSAQLLTKKDIDDLLGQLAADAAADRRFSHKGDTIGPKAPEEMQADDDMFAPVDDAETDWMGADG